MNLTQKDKLKKHVGNFLDYIQSWDQFGHPVRLTINGEDTYKTLYGAAASIALGGYLIYIMIVCLLPVVLRHVDGSSL